MCRLRVHWRLGASCLQEFQRFDPAADEVPVAACDFAIQRVAKPQAARRRFIVATVGQLNPSLRLLLGPGPCDAHPRVLTAMTTPLLGHLDPQFVVIINETQQLLREVYGTANRLTSPISATGMAGMETCMVTLLEPGDRIVVGVAGFFGQRMVEIASRTVAEVTAIERPWGEVFSLDQVR